jgi:DNA replication protein DnaC
MRAAWRGLVERAEKEQWGYEQFLGVLVAEEVAHRRGTRLRRVSSHAHFPFLKTIDDFDFTYQSTLRLALLGSSLSPDFVTEGRSLILSGKTGRGKTHLAIAIAYRAIQNGFDAVFTTAAALIDDLSRASREGRMRDALAVYTHPHVLVCDEVGYLTYGSDAANVLFHVVNERHLKKRSMIFTTNKPLSAWGQVLHDNDLAETIVDRILERGRLLTLDGPSMRTRHLELDGNGSAADTLGSTTPRAPARDGDEQPGPGGGAPGETDQLARFSGTKRADFPEPTVVVLEDRSEQRVRYYQQIVEIQQRQRVRVRG